MERSFEKQPAQKRDRLHSRVINRVLSWATGTKIETPSKEGISGAEFDAVMRQTFAERGLDYRTREASKPEQTAPVEKRDRLISRAVNLVLTKLTGVEFKTPRKDDGITGADLAASLEQDAARRAMPVGGAMHVPGPEQAPQQPPHPVGPDGVIHVPSVRPEQPPVQPRGNEFFRQ